MFCKIRHIRGIDGGISCNVILHRDEYNKLCSAFLFAFYRDFTSKSIDYGRNQGQAYAGTLLILIHRVEPVKNLLPFRNRHVRTAVEYSQFYLLAMPVFIDSKKYPYIASTSLVKMIEGIRHKVRIELLHLLCVKRKIEVFAPCIEFKLNIPAPDHILKK